MNNFISFINFTNMSDEEKYKLLNKKDYEINRLNNIIDKAIEYIEKEQELTDIDEVINTTKLLNILKGDNK